MAILALAVKSLRNRKFTVGLTVASIAMSVTLLLGVERLRHQAQSSFTNIISGTDLIVGARSSPVQLLLATVFGLGDATNNVGWESYESIAGHPGIAWTIPISLGDTHAGFRVMGTTTAFFDHFQYGRRESLRMQVGEWADSTDGATVGADVAETLGYQVGSGIVVAHGAGDVSFIEHDSHPFQVTGILARTGTPVDRAVFVSLAGIDAVHAGMNQTNDHDHDPLFGHAHGDLDHEQEPNALTAFYVGLKTRSAALSVQRMVNEFENEPLTAVLPAVALQQLWTVTGVVERTLLAVSAFVVLVGLSGMLVAIMTSLNERRREMAILRSVGARPLHVLSLIAGEAGLVTLVGILLGIALLYGLLVAAQPLITAQLGFSMPIGGMTANELLLLAVLMLAGVLVGFVPGVKSYRLSLADGMTVRI
jgi:putative ABC transport system permease protein